MPDTPVITTNNQSQKKYHRIIFAFFLLVVIAGVVIATVAYAQYRHRKDLRLHKPGNFGTTLTACQKLAANMAYDVLGPSLSPKRQESSSKTTDMRTSNCTYTQNDSIKTDKRSIASLTLKSPRTLAGVADNKVTIAKLKKTASPVTNHGDNAYWDSKTGTFSILAKNGYDLYAFKAGPPTTPNHNFTTSNTLTSFFTTDYLIDPAKITNDTANKNPKKDPCPEGQFCTGDN